MKLVVGFVILAVTFGLLERAFPLRSQKIFRQGWWTDVGHFFISHLAVQIGTFAGAVLLYVLCGGLVSPDFRAAVASQPAWLQFLEAVLVADLTFYAIHRLAHTVPALWRFHAIHHSSKSLDWLAGARLHPCDQMLGRLTVLLPLLILGFTKETFGWYLGITSVQAIFIHANIRCPLGWLQWLVATPTFHHWHHSNDPDARDKNFAGQFPAIDWLLGTLYLPKDQMPETYGVDDPVPPGYWQQLLYPWK